MTQILFGTSGHRGIIGTTFTMTHIRLICQAVADYAAHHAIPHPKVLVGYDTRTGNSPSLETNSYTFCLVSTLTQLGISVDFCESYTATPIISWAVKTYDYDLGMILTASHNPPNYNGIKINDSNGAPANVTMTDWIQSRANSIPLKQLKPSIQQKQFHQVNYTHHFIDHTLDTIKAVFNLPLTEFNRQYVIDPKCGSAIVVWKHILSNAIGEIHWLNDSHLSYFNDELPNPTSKETVQTLSGLCKKYQCVGFSNDPDADRHVLIDESGHLVSPEKLLAIVLQYCHSQHIPVQSVVSTVANSRLVHTVCTKLNIPCKETKIGFKHFTPYLKSADQANALCFGVESSGGFSMSGHSFDKCGFLPILLALGIMNKKNCTLSDLSTAIDTAYGTHHFLEDSMVPTGNYLENLHSLGTVGTDMVSDVFNTPVETVSDLDGVKVRFSNSDWVLCRPSGTEPVVRMYAESASIEMGTHYIHCMKQILQNNTH